MTEPQGNLLPFYLIVDHSGSMDEHVTQLNEGIREFLETMKFESFAASKVRISIIGFNSGAGVVLPMQDFRYVDDSAVPEFEGYGLTNLGQVLSLLADEIPRDIAALKAEGYRVFRPAAFLMTDGIPTDDETNWREALDGLAAIPAHPTMVTFGFGDADERVLAAVANKGLAYMHNGEGSVADALRKVSTSLTNSVIKSGNAMADSTKDRKLVFEPPKDFVQIDIDEV